jgi:hypothetical protein
MEDNKSTLGTPNYILDARRAKAEAPRRLRLYRAARKGRMLGRRQVALRQKSIYAYGES